MIVNDQPAVSGASVGRFLGLDLIKPLYLGGVPDFNKVLAGSKGVDCMRDGVEFIHSFSVYFFGFTEYLDLFSFNLSFPVFQVHDDTGFSTGFQGCISRLAIRNAPPLDLMQDARQKVRTRG